MSAIGKFIVIEGLEGAGKSTAMKIAASLIRAKGKQLVTTREPGGTPMAEAIRDLVKGDWADEQVTQQTELMLMYSARSQLVDNVIRPALARGDWVLGDRHDLSSQAYQGGGRGIDPGHLSLLHSFTLRDFKPDFTLYLDVEPSVGLERARGRGELDRIEKEDIGFFERTRARYQALAQADTSIVTIDTMVPIDDVHNAIKLALQDYLDANDVDAPLA